MTKFYLLVGLAALISCSSLVTKEKKQIFHNDHTVFGENKLDPHADFFAYESETLGNKNNLENSSRYRSLNGDWKFHWVRSPKDRIHDFYVEKLIT
ncbi:MAG: hypothetical protein QM485_04335 [Flavobacteriaceae bacterium]